MDLDCFQFNFIFNCVKYKKAYHFNIYTIKNKIE